MTLEYNNIIIIIILAIWDKLPFVSEMNIKDAFIVSDDGQSVVDLIEEEMKGNGYSIP